MKTQEILKLDCRKEEDKGVLKKALCNIKPLMKYAEYDEVPLEKIEKLIDVLTRKYEIKIGRIDMVAIQDEVTWYQVVVMRTDNLEHVGNCYGLTIYETLAKVAIKMYSDVKVNNIPTKKQRSSNE